MRQFIAYYRVSTQKQGVSGLGLEAQRQAVRAFLSSNDHLACEYTEIESGKRHANRPELLAALDECKRRNAVLVIAKLDRLSRNVAFIVNLMESNVDFVAVDMPTASRLTIHILAAVAENEREMISQRTKAALAVAKARGVKIGHPHPIQSAAHARACRRPRDANPEVISLMKEWRGQGKPLTEIAKRLNMMSLRTPRGFAWHAQTVSRQIARNSQIRQLISSGD